MAGAILEFEAVTLRSTSPQVEDMEEVSFCLRAGDIVLLRLEEGREHLPLADAAEGLLAPDAGRVNFCGESWSGMAPHRQSDLRGRIRRVFDTYGWVSNLDVAENLCLSESHHTPRPPAEILAEAEGLARRFGLPGIPDARPARVPAATLRRLEWVRAFMGQPALLLLERPLTGCARECLGGLTEAVAAVAERGAAVLWMTGEDRDWTQVKLTGMKRYAMQGPKLLPLAGETP